MTASVIDQGSAGHDEGAGDRREQGAPQQQMRERAGGFEARRVRRESKQQQSGKHDVQNASDCQQRGRRDERSGQSGH